MVNPITYWFKRKEYNNKFAIAIADLVENNGQPYIPGQQKSCMTKDHNFSVTSSGKPELKK